MKKFAAFFRCFELDMYADTKDEARKTAIAGFISQIENELVFDEMKARTERCDICQYTYVPSEIIKTDGEQLCVFCYGDKYESEEPNLSDIDIPF